MIPKSLKQFLVYCFLLFAHFVNLIQGNNNNKKNNFVFKKQNSTFFSRRQVVYVNKLMRNRKGERGEKNKGKRKERKGRKEGRGQMDKKLEQKHSKLIYVIKLSLNLPFQFYLPSLPPTHSVLQVIGLVVTILRISN